MRERMNKGMKDLFNKKLPKQEKKWKIMGAKVN